MNKVAVSLLALLIAGGLAQPVLAQDVASVELSRIVIAPPQSELGGIIKAGLSASYYGARAETRAYRDAQKLYFLYGQRHFEPIWLSKDTSGTITFSPAAEKIIALFRDAASEGLRPDDYLTPAIDLSKARGGDANAMAALETAFSDATLRYANHLYNGRIVPQSVDVNLDIQPKPLDEVALLEKLAKSKDPAAILGELEPTHPEFLALKAALAGFDGTGADRPAPIGTGPVLHPGNIDPRVPALRARFELPASASSVYDDALVQVVQAFQDGQGLEVDGVIGPATIAALNGGPATRREDIIANMERWRWMPRDLGKFAVMVNIPEYRLWILRDGKPEYTTRVVVGKASNQTPVFSDNIRHIVVNPYWNVPSSIIRNEVAPAVLRNPGYIDNQNMDLLYNGEAISPWSVNWNMVSPSDFPFRVRQRPGPGNALGQIKFLFPNKHDVYLHDTPSKSYFQRSTRALSHGCVRVQNPMEFADALMANEPNISRASLEAMFGSTERWVNPEHQIPVHLTYFTLRVDADGTIHSYGDVYGHNAKLIAALGLASDQPPAIIAQAQTTADDLSP
ncbi:L,D-transpeptidase family protein [Devosia sp. PTR5]|uniref:L,D-transpeptidase family protein n=1 Tax=Devosia oryzisoli TaxID=2774138 RepID=A0A927FYY9_9HYPH|nr:L,D-transpeptidase family protein [Devosia oryzisoli]MBD8067284.1 L,D-transpeptidase family protein [Devosia oryzisoli]